MRMDGETIVCRLMAFWLWIPLWKRLLRVKNYYRWLDSTRPMPRLFLTLKTILQRRLLPRPKRQQFRAGMSCIFYCCTATLADALLRIASRRRSKTCSQHSRRRRFSVPSALLGSGLQFLTLCTHLTSTTSTCMFTYLNHPAVLAQVQPQLLRKTPHRFQH